MPIFYISLILGARQVKKSLIFLEGKLMTLCQGNVILLRSSHQLPYSMSPTLEGLSTTDNYLVCAFVEDCLILQLKNYQALLW